MHKAILTAVAIYATSMVAFEAEAATDDQIACANSVRLESAEACTRVLAQAGLSTTDRALAHFNRGWSLRRSGSNDLAVKDFDAAQALQNDFPKLYLSRALAKQDLGQLDGAVVDLERYVAMAPQDWSGFHHRAAIYREQGYTAKALLDIDSALRLNPFNNELLVMKVLVMAETFNLDAAREEADRLVARRSSDAIAHFARAVVNYRRGDFAAAEADASAALAKEPRFPAAFAVKGQIAEAKGDWAKAEESYTQALRPGFPKIEMKWAKRVALLQLSSGQTKVAVETSAKPSPSMSAKEDQTQTVKSAAACSRFVPGAAMTISVPCS